MFHGKCVSKSSLRYCRISLTDYSNLDWRIMTSNYLSEEELESRVQRRTAELEKANQDLRAEIIEHKRKEEALLQSEFIYQTLFNSIDEGFYVIEMIFDENGKPVDYRFLETNSAFEKQTGLIDVQGKRMREFAPKHEEHWFEIYGRVALTGQPARFQNHAEQLNRWYDVYAFRFGEPGKRQVSILFNDITERKQTEEALRLSEEKFSIAFANNPAAIALTRLEDGLLLDVNDTWVALNGYSRDEAIGDFARTMNIWPTCEAASRFVQELREKGSLSGWEQKFYKKSGESYVAQLSAQVLTIRGEKVILSTFVDITERKRVEEALRESETRFRTMFEAHGAPMMLIEPDSGQIIDANDAAARFYEYSREQLRAMRIDQINQLSPEEVAAERYKALERGKNVFVFRHRLASGNIRWVEVYSSPVTIQRQSILFSIIHDITERKWVEEALKEAYDSLEEKVKERTAELKKAYNLLKESEISLAEAQQMAHLGNWDWNIITNEMYWSDEIYRIFGRTPQEFGATYYEFLDYVHPEDRYYVNSAVKEALNGKTYSIDYRIIMANGEERIVHEQAEVIFDKKNSQNSPVRMKGIVQDITERKKAEEALAKMEQVRIKEIHHRIKNNLQVISSLLDLQAEKFGYVEVLEAFKDSQNRIASVALIHEELYQGKGTGNMDFAAYIKRLTRELFSSYNLRKEDISLVLDLQNAYLGMDTAVPLGIVVNELVSNSLKHAFPEGKNWKVSISLRKTEDFDINKVNSETDYICGEEGNFQYIITVADNGKGIPEGIDLQTADSLGLQLVNALVEQIDGCIELKRNQGTEFTIWFNSIEK
ncbi:PAS domain S-box protein [Methanosarcina sp.]|uniref:PAS domain S-box protein n=1 Tax=Methanosarcina sp. TaxID=2213 RepID=UPI002AB9B817|nr:PAS domain S-box protein [Methanosarcina sp.]MDY9924761.1 PAS domain S-box protein [Methanosarcina sp.]